MPHVYQRTPFNTSLPVSVIGTDCSNSHPGARDIGFINMQWQVMQINNGVITGFTGTGTPVYAVESGTIVYLNRTTTCFDNRRPNPTGCNDAHSVVVKGNDGFYTEYAHVYPRDGLAVGNTVQPGTWLGNVDNSGNTTGPHVHFARFSPNTNDNLFWQNWTCDWTMTGLVSSKTTGWVRQNGKWYYFINGLPRTGWVTVGDTQYQLDRTGAWTGWVFYQGSYYLWNGTSYVKQNQGPSGGSVRRPRTTLPRQLARSRVAPPHPGKSVRKNAGRTMQKPASTTSRMKQGKAVRKPACTTCKKQVVRKPMSTKRKKPC